MGERVRVLSLGGGVQSTALLLMSIEGDVEFLDRAIFADTGWEPVAVYRHLAWLRDEVGGRVPIDVVSVGNVRADLLRGAAGLAGRFASLPLYARGEDGRLSMLRRQCTREYKVRPVRRRLRALGCRSVELWLGISWDEALRQRDSGLRWLVHRYPLIERRLTRGDCVRWLLERGYPVPPKSACVGCPFHDRERWSEMRRSDPVSWADAVSVDLAVRRLPRVRGEVFLHRAGVPLEQAVSVGDQAGEGGAVDECSGYCLT